MLLSSIIVAIMNRHTRVTMKAAKTQVRLLSGPFDTKTKVAPDTNRRMPMLPATIPGQKRPHHLLVVSGGQPFTGHEVK